MVHRGGYIGVNAWIVGGLAWLAFGILSDRDTHGSSFFNGY